MLFVNQLLSPVLILVYKHSTLNQAYRDGMEVNCKYVRRKQLTQYLCRETLEKLKSESEEGVTGALISSKRKSDAEQYKNTPVLDNSDLKKFKTEQDSHDKVAKFFFFNFINSLHFISLFELLKKYPVTSNILYT